MPLVVVPKFNLAGTLRNVERYHVNFMPVVPPIVVLLCKHPEVKKHDLSSLRAVMCSAAPLFAELIVLLRKLLPNISIGQAYGTTETGLVTFPNVNRMSGPSSNTGRLFPGILARIITPDGSLAGYGESGELVVKGPANALRYLNNEEATKETFVDGWVHTGDAVSIAETGELTVVDRIKELLKVKGFLVAPAELEGLLLSHSDVSDVCVVGVPDDYSGEVPLAFVVPRASALQRMRQDSREANIIKNSLVKYVEDSVMYYKRLTGGVEFIDVIPRNPSGKILRRVLRNHARELRVTGKPSKIGRTRL
ncbi:hypothetical protein AcV7_002036 [Taiwanofungus camphoratus]|nr:hypothetical protein AcV7_002036 [Antrodia cinnamomea]